MKILLGFVSLFFTLSSLAQNENVVSGLTASEFNGKVLLTWAIKQGYTCNGIQLLRSVDSVNFSPIGSINGVCGSTLEEVPFEFTDLSPEKKKVNYYRLNMGGIGFSVIVGVEVIDITVNNYLLRPNPINHSTELHIQNDAHQLITINVYAENGELHQSLETTEEVLFLSNQDFTSGIYFFEIRNSVDGTSLNGKLVVP